MMRISLFLILSVPWLVSGQTKQEYRSIKTTRTGQQSVYGLVSPLDRDGKNFYLINEDGQIEVKLTPDAEIGLLARLKGIDQMLRERKINFEEGNVDTSVDQTFVLPEKLYVRVTFHDWKAAQQVMKTCEFSDGIIYGKELEDHLPTADELWLSGELADLAEGHITPKKIISVNGKTFTGTTSGHNYAEQIVGIFDHTAIKPFVNQASILGELKGDVFHASHVMLRPIPDQAAKDDPKLPRYLFIGDSISGNYGPALRETLKRKLNIHHPPTNCGPSGQGRVSINQWLGNYTEKGHHWDVVSFNFGHWNSGSSKAQYQEDLEYIIGELRKTSAKLIWVTTCPVPNDYPPAGELVDKGNQGLCAPGRLAGVMEKYLNPWALEIMKRHPEISICDQWQYVKDNEATIFKEFWPKNDVHFRGEQADALGNFLADHVATRMKFRP